MLLAGNIRGVSTRSRARFGEGLDIIYHKLTSTLFFSLNEISYTIQPTPMGVTRKFTEAKALTNAIVEALDRLTPPRAVALSSVGSEQDRGLGNITQTHMLERALDRFTFPLAIAVGRSRSRSSLVWRQLGRATRYFDGASPIVEVKAVVASSRSHMSRVTTGAALPIFGAPVR